MTVILNIETSTKVCSVGVSVNGKQVYLREENTANYSHSTVLTRFIEQVLTDSKHEMKDLSAVAVSMGPGSYTGLRIGVSAAKGICYALDIPLIAVDTLKALALHARESLINDPYKRHLLNTGTIFCPMIDARRMEVYFNLFDHHISPLGQTQARIVDNEMFKMIDENKTLVLIGDGSKKCSEVLTRPNIEILPEILPSAIGMIPLADNLFENKDFVDVAYFEPFYLKDFVAGAPKVKGLYR